MLSKIIRMEDIKNGFVNNDNEGHHQSDMMDIALFMQYSIDILKNIIDRQEQLFKKVKKLEQAKTFFPMTEDKHRALLNNCVDDDEVILHKREIEALGEVKK